MPLHTTPTGFLWDRIEIWKATAVVADGQGGQTRTYTKVLTVPGRVRETSGQKYSDSEGRMISWQAAAGWLDCRADLTAAPAAGDRLKTPAGETFEVLTQSVMEFLVECELKKLVP